MATEQYVDKIERLSEKARAWADLSNGEKVAMLRRCACTVSDDALCTGRVAADIIKAQKLGKTEGGEFESLLQTLILFQIFPTRWVLRRLGRGGEGEGGRDRERERKRESERERGRETGRERDRDTTERARVGDPQSLLLTSSSLHRANELADLLEEDPARVDGRLRREGLPRLLARQLWRHSRVRRNWCVC